MGSPNLDVMLNEKYTFTVFEPLVFAIAAEVIPVNTLKKEAE